MNCDTCPHGYSPEDETCRHCPLYPEEKSAPSVSTPASPAEAVPVPLPVPVQTEPAASGPVPTTLPLEYGKETAPYFSDPPAEKPPVKKARDPYPLRQRVVAVLLSVCLFLGSVMIGAGYMADHVWDHAPASRFLTKDTAAVLTASMPDTPFFLGIRLERHTVETILLNTRIQKYLDDLIEGLHTYMRTGIEPKFNFSAIATRLVRLIRQEQLLYMTIDGRTYMSESECAAALSQRLSDSLRQLLIVCDKERGLAERQETLQSLTRGVGPDADKILEVVAQVQGLMHLPAWLFWGGLAVCAVSLGLLLFFNRRRRGRALLFAAVPLFLCGLLLLVVLAPPLLPALFGGSNAALMEGALHALYGAVIGPAVIMLVSGGFLALVYGMDRFSLPARLFSRIRRGAGSS